MPTTARVLIALCLLTVLTRPAVAEPLRNPVGPFTRITIERAVRETLATEDQHTSGPSKPKKRDSNVNGVLIGAGVGAAMGPLLVMARGGSDSFAAVSFGLGALFGGVGAVTGLVIDNAF